VTSTESMIAASASVDAERARISQPLDSRPVCQAVAQTSAHPTRESSDEVAEQASAWWYLSFADDTFRGGVVVRGDDVVSALEEANRLGINPGGQVLGVPLTSDHVPAASYRERLLSRDDCDACWDDCVQFGDLDCDIDESLIPIVEQTEGAP